MRKRIKFVKEDDIRFISHLDTMRFLERAVRRAGIPVDYTHGFNPQPKMSIALPLTLGYTSEAEYMDIDIDESKLPLGCELNIADKLNPFMPHGISITDEDIVESKISLMAMIKYAKYKVKFNDIPGRELLSSDIDVLLNRDKTIVEKHTKNGIKNINILKDIIKIDVVSDGLICLVNAGTEKNLNPSLIVRALNKYGRNKYDIKEIRRLEVYDKNMNPPLTRSSNIK